MDGQDAKADSQKIVVLPGLIDTGRGKVPTRKYLQLHGMCM